MVSKIMNVLSARSFKLHNLASWPHVLLKMFRAFLEANTFDGLWSAVFHTLYKITFTLQLS